MESPNGRVKRKPVHEWWPDEEVKRALMKYKERPIPREDADRWFDFLAEKGLVERNAEGCVRGTLRLARMMKRSVGEFVLDFLAGEFSMPRYPNVLVGDAAMVCALDIMELDAGERVTLKYTPDEFAQLTLTISWLFEGCIGPVAMVMAKLSWLASGIFQYPDGVTKGGVRPAPAEERSGRDRKQHLENVMYG